MPFGSDANDLPLQSLQMDFNLSLSTLLLPHVMNPPEYTYEAGSAELYVHEQTLEQHLENVANGSRISFAKEHSLRRTVTKYQDLGDVHGVFPAEAHSRTSHKQTQQGCGDVSVTPVPKQASAKTSSQSAVEETADTVKLDSSQPPDQPTLEHARDPALWTEQSSRSKPQSTQEYSIKQETLC